MISSKKGLYHSELVRFGPAFVTIKSDVIPSKPQYAKGYGKFLILDHEGTEHTFNVENANVEAALKGLKNQQVTITASGARDDATLSVSGGTPRASATTGRTVSSASPKDVANQWSQATKLALDTVQAIKDEHMPKMTADQFQALVSGLVIYFDRQGVIEGMPVKSGAEQSATAAGATTADDEIPF